MRPAQSIKATRSLKKGASLMPEEPELYLRRKKCLRDGMVDMRDLKSRALDERAGSSPVAGTTEDKDEH